MVCKCSKRDIKKYSFDYDESSLLTDEEKQIILKEINEINVKKEKIICEKFGRFKKMY